MRLSAFKALTFDVYGTLIDWEGGIVQALAPLAAKAGNPPRDTVLEAHARAESAAQAETPGALYSEILTRVYLRLAEEWGADAAEEEARAYGGSVKDWPAFEDSRAALAYLKNHYTLAVLSNVDNAGFAHSNKKLGAPFHAVFTAEDAGSYKPAQRNFDFMIERMAGMGIEKHEILHTAESLFHDHAPAKKAGLSNCWIYRRHAQPGFGATMDPGEKPEIDMVFHSMAELAEAHRAETAAG